MVDLRRPSRHRNRIIVLSKYRLMACSPKISLPT